MISSYQRTQNTFVKLLPFLSPQPNAIRELSIPSPSSGPCLLPQQRGRQAPQAESLRCLQEEEKEKKKKKKKKRK